MNLTDMHCDTLWNLMDLGGVGDLKRNDGHVSIEKMRDGGTRTQFFACFTDAVETGEMEGESRYEACWKKVQRMCDYLEEQTKTYASDIAKICTWKEIQQNLAQNRISAVVTVEEGGILNGHSDRLEELYMRGVRLITLMWNYENCIGYPNSRNAEQMRKGLKLFGREVVEKMLKKRMTVDVSHASDGVFWDVMELARGTADRVVASHSNCRSLCGHPRNLSNGMIKALAECGGVSGLNFYGYFLSDTHGAESKLEDMVAHIEHMIQVGGSDFPAIGTDFDGFDGMQVMEIPDVSYMERLWNRLKKRGMTEAQLDKIWYKNAERIVSAW